MADIGLDTTASVPTGTSIAVTVYEDTNGDGVFENEATQSIGDGTNSYTLSGFDAASGNEFAVFRTIETGGDETLEPSISSLSVDTDPSTVAQGSVTSATASDIVADGVREKTGNAATSGTDIVLETTANVPAGSSIDVTVYEDTNGDGTFENETTQAIDDGTNSYNITSSFDGSAGNEFAVFRTIETGGDETLEPYIGSLTIDTAGGAGGTVATASDVQATATLGLTGQGQITAATASDVQATASIGKESVSTPTIARAFSSLFEWDSSNWDGGVWDASGPIATGTLGLTADGTVTSATATDLQSTPTAASTSAAVVDTATASDLQATPSTSQTAAAFVDQATGTVIQAPSTAFSSGGVIDSAAASSVQATPSAASTGGLLDSAAGSSTQGTADTSVTATPDTVSTGSSPTPGTGTGTTVATGTGITAAGTVSPGVGVSDTKAIVQPAQATVSDVQATVDTSTTASAVIEQASATAQESRSDIVIVANLDSAVSSPITASVDATATTAPVPLPQAKEGNYALLFEQNDRVSMGSGYAGQSHTVCFWIRRNSEDESSYETVVANGDGSVANDGTGGRLPYVYLNTGDHTTFHWRVSTDVSGNDGLNTSSILPAHEWVFIAGVVDYSDPSLTIYKNGSVTDTTTLSSTTPGSGTGNFELRGDGRTEEVFSLDDVRYYDRPLSQSEISSIQNGDSVPSGLAGRWNFEEGSGSTVIDQAGTNDGTITGAQYGSRPVATDLQSPSSTAVVSQASVSQATVSDIQAAPSTSTTVPAVVDSATASDIQSTPTTSTAAVATAQSATASVLQAPSTSASTAEAFAQIGTLYWDKQPWDGGEWVGFGPGTVQAVAEELDAEGEQSTTGDASITTATMTTFGATVASSSTDGNLSTITATTFLADSTASSTPAISPTSATTTRIDALQSSSSSTSIPIGYGGNFVWDTNVWDNGTYWRGDTDDSTFKANARPLFQSVTPTTTASVNVASATASPLGSTVTPTTVGDGVISAATASDVLSDSTSATTSDATVTASVASLNDTRASLDVRAAIEPTSTSPTPATATTSTTANAVVEPATGSASPSVGVSDTKAIVAPAQTTASDLIGTADTSVTGDAIIEQASATGQESRSDIVIIANLDSAVSTPTTSDPDTASTAQSTIQSGSGSTLQATPNTVQVADGSVTASTGSTLGATVTPITVGDGSITSVVGTTFIDTFPIATTTADVSPIGATASPISADTKLVSTVQLATATASDLVGDATVGYVAGGTVGATATDLQGDGVTTTTASVTPETATGSDIESDPSTSTTGDSVVATATGSPTTIPGGVGKTSDSSVVTATASGVQAPSESIAEPTIAVTSGTGSSIQSGADTSVTATPGTLDMDTTPTPGTGSGTTTADASSITAAGSTTTSTAVAGKKALVQPATGTVSPIKAPSTSFADKTVATASVAASSVTGAAQTTTQTAATVASSAASTVIGTADTVTTSVSTITDTTISDIVAAGDTATTSVASLIDAIGSDLQATATRSSIGGTVTGSTVVTDAATADTIGRPTFDTQTATAGPRGASASTTTAAQARLEQATASSFGNGTASTTGVSVTPTAVVSPTTGTWNIIQHVVYFNSDDGVFTNDVGHNVARFDTTYTSAALTGTGTNSITVPDLTNSYDIDPYETTAAVIVPFIGVETYEIWPNKAQLDYEYTTADVPSGTSVDLDQTHTKATDIVEVSTLTTEKTR